MAFGLTVSFDRVPIGRSTNLNSYLRNTAVKPTKLSEFSQNMSSSTTKRPVTAGVRGLRPPTALDPQGALLSPQNPTPTITRVPSMRSLSISVPTVGASPATCSPAPSTTPTQAPPSRPASAVRKGAPVLNKAASVAAPEPLRNRTRSNSVTRNSAPTPPIPGPLPSARGQPLLSRPRKMSSPGDSSSYSYSPLIPSVATTDSTVKVFLRLRPLNDREQRMDGGGCFAALDRYSVTVNEVANKPRKYNFDHVLDPNTAQTDVFGLVARPMCDACLSGVNGTIFAYGQTGSGKTFTIQGAEIREDTKGDDGLMPRSAEYLFHALGVAQERAEANKVRFRYNVTCTFVEIYNEAIYDLLDSSPEKCVGLAYANDGFVMTNAVQEVVNNAAECRRLMVMGASNRHTSSTLMNCESSRSHSVFTLNVSVEETSELGDKITRHSRLHLIDLAGSERLSNTGVSGEGLKEAQNINKSLSMLSNVIARINEDAENGRGKGHIPYRNSTLTKLLMDSLGGNSLTYVVACVSPAAAYTGETVSTLRFAESARKVANRPTVNEERTPSAIISQLQAENRQLQRALQNVLSSLQNKGEDGQEIDIAQFTALLTNDSDEVEQAMETLRGEVRVAAEARDAALGQCMELQGALATKEDELRACEAMLRESEEVNNTLTAEKQAVEQRLVQTEQELVNTQGELADEREARARVEEELRVRTGELASARDEISDLTARNTTLLQRVEALEQENAEMHRRNEELHRLNTNLQAQNEELQRRVDKLSEKLVNAVNKAKEYLDLSETRRMHIEQLQGELQAEQQRCADLEKAKAQVEKQLQATVERFTAEVQEKDCVIAADTRLIANQNGEISTLQEELARERQDVAALREALSKEQAAHASTQSRMQREHAAAAATWASERDALNSEATELRADLQETEGKLVAANGQVEELEATVRKQEDDIIKLSGHHNPNQRINVLQQLKVENDELKRDNLRLKQQLAAVAKELRIVTRPAIIPTAKPDAAASSAAPGTAAASSSPSAGTAVGSASDDSPDENAIPLGGASKTVRPGSAKPVVKPLTVAKLPLARAPLK